ncbi:MAG: DMT family transporter [Eubacteriales bacterium]|nr:DMT family transporter [Eubacteriales bacterium]MDD3289355.1 DMT family transporter [Eubacteriales bacterium]MDD3863518.1 DMT family transporter [Eubacteriales bacterium]
MSKRTGLIFAMGAAFFYGVSTITGKMSYVGGGNPVALSFYRNLISVPLLFAVLRLRKTDLSVTRRECAGLAWLGLLGGFVTGVLLYISYTLISVGLSTCLHFSFPVILAVIYALFYHEKFSRIKILALVLGIAGVWFFVESDARINSLGILTALLSGVTYAAYLIVMDRRGLKSMDGYKLSFYCCLFSSLWLGFFGTVRGYPFQGVLDSNAWMYITATAVLVSVLGNTMIPVAVRNVGATVTGIAGILEPVTSVLLGVLLLGEPFGFRSIVGAACVLTAAILLGLEKDPKSRLNSGETA